jgi:fumarylacetoacetate (FAA) hydrolase family protein
VTRRAPDWTTAEVRCELDDGGDPARDPLLLPPVDLQVLKACGVTYAGSMIERVIEERAHGDPAAAAEVRNAMRSELDLDLADIVPGSDEAARVKQFLSHRGWWSQYLEVGLGPDPEVFTKGPVLSSVGSGAAIGIPAFSHWNNPEPELVLIVTPGGRIAGVTLGNDVNLRDVEGRSALLLGMAKDNNRSTSLGPFIRLFDDAFSLEDAGELTIALNVTGADGFELEGINSVAALSRSFESLVDAAYGPHHQYPDGFALFTGTLFAPTEDRDAPGEGFTHRPGDVVTIGNPHLGTLVNAVARTEELPPWEYGIRTLWRDLARLRGNGDADA